MLRVHGAASPNNIPMMQAEKEKKSGIAIDKISDRYLDSFDSYFSYSLQDHIRSAKWGDRVATR